MFNTFVSSSSANVATSNPNISLKEVNRVVKIEENEALNRDYYRSVDGDNIYAKQYSTGGVAGWYIASGVGGDIHTLIDGRAFIEVEDGDSISLDELAYSLAEWACFRSTWVDRMATVSLWAEINRHDLTQDEIEYVFKNWSSYIKGR